MFPFGSKRETASGSKGKGEKSHSSSKSKGKGKGKAKENKQRSGEGQQSLKGKERSAEPYSYNDNLAGGPQANPLSSLGEQFPGDEQIEPLDGIADLVLDDDTPVGSLNTRRFSINQRASGAVNEIYPSSTHPARLLETQTYTHDISDRLGDAPAQGTQYHLNRNVLSQQTNYYGGQTTATGITSTVGGYGPYGQGQESYPDAAQEGQEGGEDEDKFSWLGTNADIQGVKNQQHRGSLQKKSLRLYKSSEFWQGRVVKLWWFETEGENSKKNRRGSNAGNETLRREGGEGEWRRFVIVQTYTGHSIGIPIHTYNNRGTKKNVQRAHHAMIYTTPRPDWLPGEVPLPNTSIRMDNTDTNELLHKASRINYAKKYTIEHNVLVEFIGHIHDNSRIDFWATFDRINPQVGQPPPRQRANSSAAQFGNTSTAAQHITPRSGGGYPALNSEPYYGTSNAVPQSSATATISRAVDMSQISYSTWAQPSTGQPAANYISGSSFEPSGYTYQPASSSTSRPARQPARYEYDEYDEYGRKIQ